MALGHVAVYEAHYNEAVSHYAKAVQANPRHSWLHFCQAVALALAGRVEEAGPIVQQLLELNPGFRSTGASMIHQSEHSRLGSKKARAYSACLNSSSTRTVECSGALRGSAQPNASLVGGQEQTAAALRCQSAACARIGVRLLRRGCEHIIRRQRPPDPLQLELADRLDLSRRSRPSSAPAG